ncbi:MAG TPA: EAL domain-containing protein, partial [Nevskiaceae bacterium]|nr:EAL domain-containing protein [Nevskiaceae bacterium]
EAATLFSLKKMGCRLTLSQFGAGKGSLETLQSLPLDFIKLDVKLTEEASKSDEARGKLKQVVGLAAPRNIGTISTRVADAMTLAELWKLGVNFVQGHYVHEPEIVVEEKRR